MVGAAPFLDVRSASLKPTIAFRPVSTSCRRSRFGRKDKSRGSKRPHGLNAILVVLAPAFVGVVPDCLTCGPA